MSLRSSMALAIWSIVFVSAGCKRPTPIPISATVGTGSFAAQNVSAWYAFRGNDVFLLVWLDVPSSSSTSSGLDHVLGTFAGRNVTKSIGIDYSDGNVQIDGHSYALK